MKVTREAFADEASWLQFQHNQAELERRERLRQDIPRQRYRFGEPGSRAWKAHYRTVWREGARARYVRDHDHVIAVKRAWRITNAEKVREIRRRSYQKHREENCLRKQVYYWDHREERLAYNRTWYQSPSGQLWRKKYASSPDRKEQHRHAARERYTNRRNNSEFRRKRAVWNRNSRERHKNDPVWVEKERARQREAKRRKSQDPVYKEAAAARTREWRSRKKASDPQYLERQRQQQRQRLADDPVLMAKYQAKQAAYYQRRKDDLSYQERCRINEAAYRARKKAAKQQSDGAA